MLRVPVTVVMLLAAGSLLGWAGGPDKDLVDIAPVRDKLTVLETEAGHVVVIEAFDTGSDHFYFGDGKRLYRQRTFSGSRNGDTAFSRSFWAPRHDHRASIQFRDGSWSIECGKRATPLVVASDKKAAAVLDKGKFYLPLWKREAYALARDDAGVYYYVDRLREARGGKGFRVFVGKKGRLKEQAMVDVTVDTEGAIFSTKKGELRLIIGAGGHKGRTTWVRGKNKEELITVPVLDNLYLVYEELGVYEGQLLGTPCDFYRE